MLNFRIFICNIYSESKVIMLPSSLSTLYLNHMRCMIYCEALILQILFGPLVFVIRQSALIVTLVCFFDVACLLALERFYRQRKRLINSMLELPHCVQAVRLKNENVVVLSQASNPCTLVWQWIRHGKSYSQMDSEYRLF